VKKVANDPSRRRLSVDSGARFGRCEAARGGAAEGAASVGETSASSRAGPGAAGAGLLAALGAAVVIAMTAVWCVDYLPTHDGPQHIFGIHAANRLQDQQAGYGAFLEASFPITNHGFALVYMPFDSFLPWKTALKVAMTLLVLIWIVGAAVFARAVHLERSWLGVALSVAAFQWSLYMGFFSFYIATGFGLFVLAIAFRVPRWSARQRLLLAGLLFVQALLHVVPALVTGMILAILVASRSDRSRWISEGSKLALMGLPAACVALAVSTLDMAELGGHTEADWSHVWPGPWVLGKCFVGGPAWRAWPLTLAALAAPASVLALGKSRIRPEDRALLVAGGLLLIAAVALPLDLRAWDFFSVRFIPMGVCCLVAAIPLERVAAASWKRALVGALVLYAVAGMLWALHYNRDLDERSAEALSGLQANLSRNGPRLPIVLDPHLGRPYEDREADMPYALPLWNLGQLYATSQGGLVPRVFAVNEGIHHVLYREEWEESFPATPYRIRTTGLELAKPENRGDVNLRGALTTYSGIFGAAFQDIIVWGRPEDGDLLINRGYVPEWRQGGLMIARFEGCPLALTLPASVGREGTVVVEMGWYPLWDGARRYRVKPTAELREPVVVPLDRAPCGAVWVRVRVDAGAGRESASDVRFCDGSDSEGRLVVPSTRATPVVRCALPESEPGAPSRLSKLQVPGGGPRPFSQNGAAHGR
jgi:hypothetical protein